MATAAVVLFFAFTAFGNVLDTLQLEQDEEALGDEVADLEEHYSDLIEVRDYLKSDEYVEWVARRELGLVRPGEIGIIALPRYTPTAVAEGEEASPSEAAEPQPRWWEVVAGH